MNSSLYALFFIISFLASCVGAICGIGGGVIIKPVLDVFGVLSVSTISFLSGCTVLAMSLYSWGKNKMAGESLVEAGTGTSLALGAALGGVAGKSMFQTVAGMFSDKDTVGAVQAICLLLMTVGTLLYTLRKDRIHTYRFKNPMVCGTIGLLLGIVSSFLGIGGGPMNLVVLFYFFSMDTRKAAQNSLYIILFSQATSLMSTLLTRSVPDFSPWLLLLMVGGGVLGGISGRVINKKIKESIVDRLFIVLMLVIIGISVYNICRFTA